MTTQPQLPSNQATTKRHDIAVSSSLLLIHLFSGLLGGCATTPNYLPAPSAKQTNIEHKREQIQSPAAKQIGGAALSGILGGLLGPVGILVTSIGSAATQKAGLTSYWKSISGTELVGVIIEDVTEQRNKEFLSNPSWFKHLPSKDQRPKQWNVDFGNGNSFVFPVASNIKPHIGDVVTIISPATAYQLMDKQADFEQDLPKITSVRCMAYDLACVKNPENELGVAKRFNQK